MRDEHLTITKFGFEWGACRVTRVTDRDGGVLIGVGTVANDEWDFPIQIWVSPKGRRIRVFRQGKELK